MHKYEYEYKHGKNPSHSILILFWCGFSHIKTNTNTTSTSTLYKSFVFAGKTYRSIHIVNSHLAVMVYFGAKIHWNLEPCPMLTPTLILVVQ